VHSNPPKKRLGQHFLKDPNTARIVVEGVTGDDVVLEVGPGRGFLTTFLAERAKLVYAIELDPDVTAELRRAIRSFDNVIVHEADALRFDYESLRPAPNKLVANLPYNVASPLVLRLLEEVQGLHTLRFMVQLEVARRMAASRGTKDYGAYAVLVQLLAEVEVAHRVSPNVFDPPPRVYSAVVEMKRRRPGLRLDEFQDVKELVLAAFKSRRKRLLNNLPGGSRTAASRALEFVGYGPGVRAEELAPEDFVALYRALSGET
jgi:16S rRNA (adenine1518-N6/adenine1519-N6)-dimethyltransferase